MKNLIVAAVALSILLSCTPEEDIVRAGVFDGYGGAQTCIWETVQAIKIDSTISVRTVTTSDIAFGVLDSLDVLVIPGGGGARQYLNLGKENQKRIMDFVLRGNGVVGICAGAYLFSDTPDYACLHLNGAEAIDRVHDNRGHGIAKFTVTREGWDLFPELEDLDTCYIYYYEGPVLQQGKSGVEYQTLAVMESDVHQEGNAPSGMTNNRPLFITNTYGRGRVFSSIAHPEATPGMRWIVPRMVRWAAKREAIPYKERWKRISLFGKENLFSPEMLKKERELLDTLIYGEPESKIAAMDWLQENLSWDAKRWIQGLLFDYNSDVRMRAFRYIIETEYTQFEPDLRAALKNEPTPSLRDDMRQLLLFWQQ